MSRQIRLLPKRPITAVALERPLFQNDTFDVLLQVGNLYENINVHSNRTEKESDEVDHDVKVRNF
jgi:hypothetical protein